MNGIEIGKRAKRLRFEADMAQKAVAQAGGMRQSLLSQLERGHIMDPRLSTLQGVATGLGLSLTELIEPDRIRRDMLMMETAA